MISSYSFDSLRSQKSGFSIGYKIEAEVEIGTEGIGKVTAPIESSLSYGKSKEMSEEKSSQEKNLNYKSTRESIQTLYVMKLNTYKWDD